MKKILILAASTLILYSCKKNGGNSGGNNPPPKDSAKCIITGEATNEGAVDFIWSYKYDDKGNPKEIIKVNSYNQIVSRTNISSLGTTITGDDTKLVTSYNNSNAQADIFTGYPTSSDVSSTIGTLEQHNYWHYDFSYDARHRLTGVSEHTNTNNADYEWALHITYDDKDDVTELRYEFTTGPRNPVTIFRATSYDDKPTPYAGVKGWQFLGSFAWNNSDPMPVLTALSAHNPLEFTMGIVSQPDLERRTMTYTYNENGFPVKIACRHDNKSTITNWLQSYTYNCK